MNNKTERVFSLPDKYKALGIAERIDYNKFYLHSLITHSTVIEGSTVTITERLYKAILKNNKLNYAEYGVGVSEVTIKRRLSELRRAEKIVRVGSNKSGYWKVVRFENRKEGKI